MKKNKPKGSGASGKIIGFLIIVFLFYFSNSAPVRFILEKIGLRPSQLLSAILAAAILYLFITNHKRGYITKRIKTANDLKSKKVKIKKGEPDYNKRMGELGLLLIVLLYLMFFR